MKRLDGAVALVTGGASGLGKAIAQRLAVEGARVVISDLDRGLGQTTAADNGFLFIEQDVCDESRWDSVVDEIGQQFGKLDILVNNAGVIEPTDSANPEDTR